MACHDGEVHSGAGDDGQVEAKRQELMAVVIAWAKAHDLWQDARFWTWAEYYNSEPEEEGLGNLAILTFEGPLYNLLNGYFDDGGKLHDEFYELVWSSGFIVELEDNTTASFYLDDENDGLQPLVRDWNAWQWVLRLVEDDVFDLHEEVYEAFAKDPDRLITMRWRQFEKFLDGVFRNNGFGTQLGAGRSDGGIDLRLYNHDAVGELVTLVQAKRYERRAITVDAVQALAGAVEDTGANRGLFVTTSRYLPSARKFADRHRHRITLADKESVGAWSAAASRHIVEARGLTALKEACESIKTVGQGWLEGRIFHAHDGYNTIGNNFAVLLRSSSSAGLFVRIPSVELPEPDGAQPNLYIPRQRGTEIPKPVLEPEDLRESGVFRARRSGDNRFWGRRQGFTPWDGAPCWFDYMD